MTTNTRSSLRTFAGLTLAVVAFCLFPSGTAFAQTQEPPKPTPEVEQLKQRLQQLEQTVSDLKGQLNAIEEAKKKETTPAIVEAKYTLPQPVDSPAPAPAEKSQNNNGKGESTFSIYGFAMLDAGY
ncbi:MAG TPA: hypothetical protein VFS84_03550, partial [Candidatus Binatia bacterium]|nr:hypothetical protein [Candidatus Binatia bacterium]